VSTPFDIELIQARLRDQVPTLKQVRGIVEYAAIQSIKAFAPPEAFVVLVRERGGALAGQAAQLATVSFGVVIAERTARDARLGGEVMKKASPFIGQVRAALIGWTPTNNGTPLRGGRPCTWVQGDLLDYDADTVLWSEVYQTQHFVGRQQ
jgi:hypothetical protein